MKKLIELYFPGWRLRNFSNERMHWAKKRKLSRPPVPAKIVGGDYDKASVSYPHKRRKVVITRIGKRDMDRDGLYHSVKPVLDGLKARVMKFPNGGEYAEFGLFYDDSDKYIDLEVKQERGDYGVRVVIYG